MGTAGAVRRGDLVALDRDLDVVAAVEKVVDRLLGVAAGDDHRRRSQSVDSLRQQ